MCHWLSMINVSYPNSIKTNPLMWARKNTSCSLPRCAFLLLPDASSGERKCYIVAGLIIHYFSVN